MPRIQSVYSSLRSKELEVVGITRHGWMEGTRKYLKDRGVTLPVTVTRDATPEFCDRYGLAGPPTTYLLDSQGRIVWRQYNKLNEEDLRFALAKLGIE